MKLFVLVKIFQGPDIKTWALKQRGQRLDREKAFMPVLRRRRLCDICIVTPEPVGHCDSKQSSGLQVAKAVLERDRALLFGEMLENVFGQYPVDRVRREQTAPILRRRHIQNVNVGVKPAIEFSGSTSDYDVQRIG
jgi:hypothetical protein